MGKVDLTSIQTKLLVLFGSDSYIPNTFYLTGGTALSAFYYQHRESEDIDLFTPQPYDQNYIGGYIREQAKINDWSIEFAQVFERQTYEITWGKEHTKVEFVHYPYKQVEDSTLRYNNITVDTKTDIAINKLLTISQRTTTKDFVDLYFLLQKDFTTWDLMRGVEEKFGMEIEPFYLASLFAKVAEVTTLPIMKKPLTLKHLQDFFITQAKELGSKMVEK